MNEVIGERCASWTCADERSTRSVRAGMSPRTEALTGVQPRSRPGSPVGLPVALLFALLLALLVVAMTACGPDSAPTESLSAPRPTGAVPTPSTPPPPPAPPLPPTPAPTVPTVTALPTDQDGRIFVLVTGLDTTARTMTVDVARYVGGAEHRRWLASDPSRWSELLCGDGSEVFDGTQDPETCESLGQDQAVVNESPRLRTLSIRDDATFAVALGGSGEKSSVDFHGFADYVGSGMRMGDTFFLTVHEGWVTDVEFQFFS